MVKGKMFEMVVNEGGLWYNQTIKGASAMKKILVTLLMLCMFLCGCEERSPFVAVTCYPLQYLVERISGGFVGVTTISSDDYIQRASIKENYKEIIEKSDALFYINSLEPYMDIYYDELHDTSELVDLSVRSAIYKFARYTTTYVNDSAAVVLSDYYEGKEFANIESYENDPMLWLDPVAMTSMASDIRDYFVNKYPQYQMLFDENYNQLELDLARLDAGFSEIYNNKQNVSFVSMTPSFGNWQKSYGIHVYPVSLSRYGVLPNEEQLELIKKRIRNDHVRYIAIEENISEDMVALRELLIDELGLIPIRLSNISSLSENENLQKNDYLSIMYGNLETLRKIAQ